MSGFRRTSSGLNNQHLFYNVDLIVFLEGGKRSFNTEEVYEGNYTEETEDMIFWKRIFSIFDAKNKIKFKSIGSKKTIKELVTDIIDGKLTNVKVAMDNEFDEILNKRIDHPGVYYTHGYSWENDIWNPAVVKAVIEELSAVNIENDDIEKNLNEFIDKMRVAVNADGYLFKQDSSFFPRKGGYFFCIDLVGSDLPTIREYDITKKLLEKGLTKRKVNRFGNKHAIETLKFCFGHLLADYCYHLITHYIKRKHFLTIISKDIIYRIGINKYFNMRFEIEPAFAYYQNMFEKNGKSEELKSAS